ELPEGVTAELGPLATPIGEVYRYSLTGAGNDPMKLRSLQEWVVRPRLLRVPGVADVVSYGGLVKEIQVQPSPSRLAAFDLQLDDLERALRQASVNASGGVHESLPARAGVMVKIDPFYDRTDLVDTTLKTVAHNLLEGATLVLVVLLVFLLDWRAALIVGTTIPLSLLTAFLYLKSRGMSANLLSMGAVDFGIIV